MKVRHLATYIYKNAVRWKHFLAYLNNCYMYKDAMENVLQVWILIGGAWTNLFLLMYNLSVGAISEFWILGNYC